MRKSCLVGMGLFFSYPAFAEEVKLGLDYKFVHESSDVLLNGHGVSLDGQGKKEMKKGSLVLDLEDLTLMQMNYADNTKNKLFLRDLDTSGTYAYPLGDKANLSLGLNLDTRSANIEYAGVRAVTGNYAIGPELGLSLSLEKLSIDASAMTGWGRGFAETEFNKQNDALSKNKVYFEGMYRVAELLYLGLSFNVENNLMAIHLDDGGEVASKERILNFEIKSGFEILPDLKSRLDLGYVNNLTLHSGTDSLVFQLGFEYKIY